LAFAIVAGANSSAKTLTPPKAWNRNIEDPDTGAMARLLNCIDRRGQGRTHREGVR
jgi:hypothetical protein